MKHAANFLTEHPKVTVEQYIENFEQDINGFPSKVEEFGNAESP